MNNPTKIAVLAPYPVYPAKMGGQKCIAYLYEYLNKKMPVSIISTAGNELPVDSKLTLFPILGRSFLRYMNPLLFFSMRKIINQQAFTHLILEHPYFGWLGYLLSKATGVELIVHSHNIEALRFRSTGRWWWRILWKYERFTHRHADKNFFITDEDREYAVAKYGLEPSKCYTVTYGFSLQALPPEQSKIQSRAILQKRWALSNEDVILLFNGTLSYEPNLEALKIILSEINPRLKKLARFSYRIIICGKDLPGEMKLLEAYKNDCIIYAGFVDDINTYFKGADIFLNPVTEGGGIKTKLVEALGFNLSAVSTITGAIGIPRWVTGKKMLLAHDNDWDAFTNMILQTDHVQNTPLEFFQHFYWANIAAKAAGIILNKTQ